MAKGTLCLGSLPASLASLPSLATVPGIREKNLLSRGMVVLCQLCGWTHFNDHFLHIPDKTLLQMEYRSRNSIWELGCCSEAVWCSHSGSLTRQGRSGLGMGELASKPLWCSSWICWMECGDVWTWGRLVLLSSSSRNLILFVSSLWHLGTKFSSTPAKAACQHPRQLWPFQQWYLRFMESVLSKEPLAVICTPDNNLIIWITWNFWETKVISMTWSENYFYGQVLGVDRMVWGGFLSSCSFKRSLWLQEKLNLKMLWVLAAVSWLCVFSFQLENLHRSFSLNTKFELKVSLVFHRLFLNAQNICETSCFLLTPSDDLYLQYSHGVRDFTSSSSPVPQRKNIASWTFTLNNELLWFLS